MKIEATIQAEQESPNKEISIVLQNGNCDIPTVIITIEGNRYKVAAVDLFRAVRSVTGLVV